LNGTVAKIVALKERGLIAAEYAFDFARRFSASSPENRINSSDTTLIPDETTSFISEHPLSNPDKHLHFPKPGNPQIPEKSTLQHQSAWQQKC
jgi:hypothetical protein